MASHAASCLLAAEEIEAVDDVEHGVAVDGVVLDVAATHCRYRSGEIGLVVEDVVELERDGQSVALQEALRELRVPYQLVRVHRLVRIATP